MNTAGPYIPFTKPVPVPGALADDDPLMHVCFNEEWLPAVIGALKVLARPESWQGTLAEIQDITKSAHDLMASYADGCGRPCPAFFPQENATKVTPYDSTKNSLRGCPVCPDCPSAYESYLVVARFSSALGIARFTAEMRKVSGFHDRCGGDQCDLFARQTDFTAANVWTFQWRDCLGSNHIETFNGESYHKAGFDAQWWCLTSLAPYACVFSIDGPVLCGSA